jgi:hypothetical protein
MKRIALFAVVALFAACGPKEEPATETSADSAAVAAPVDTAAAHADTTKKDSTHADTTHK